MNTPKFDYNSFKVAGQMFMTTLVEKLIDAGVPANSLDCDHLCFRVSSLDEYDFYKKNLSDHGQLLTEALVNGRPISTFRLHQAFQTSYHTIALLELPAPKPKVFYPIGFEHAEFVIKQCFNTFSSRFPNLKFKKSGHKNLNPELSLKLGQNIQAKFHHLSLDRVIEIEEAEIKDIIFDFDGTLIKSRENIYAINQIVFSKALNREVSLQESIDKFHPEFSKLFEAFAVTCPLRRSDAIASWGEVASQFSYDLFDDVLGVLTELKKNGFRLHLWTARDEYSARKILKEHRIEDIFTTLSFATDIDSKPHANSLNFDWKNAQKNQVIVIGDSPSDIIGAKNINAIAAAALWDVHASENSLVAAGAEVVFFKVTDFKDWVIK